MAFVVKIMHLFWFLVFVSVGRKLAFSAHLDKNGVSCSSTRGAARGGSTRLSPSSSTSATSTHHQRRRRRFRFVPRSEVTMHGAATATKIHQTTVQQPPPPPPVVDQVQPTTTDTTTSNNLHDNVENNKKKNTAAPPAITGGSASMSASIFNLVNNVAGAGILTLSAGMAAGTGWVSASLICAVLGFISAHTFTLIGEACQLTGEQDFKGLWARTMGPNSTFIVDGMIAILCLACTVIYSGILGDVFTPLLARAGLPSHLNGRSANILVMTATLLFPLCMIKNLSALAFTSILGFCAITYTVLFIVIRSLDGTYKLATGGATATAGKFIQDGMLKHVPSFTKSSLWRMDFTSLVLVSNLGLAYIAHYNGPAFYRELKDTNPKRFGIMVRISFLILTALYVTTMVSGYRTFGDVCQGNLLLNYHPKDILSTLGRLATGCSILFGYPLIAAGAREGLAGFIEGISNVVSSRRRPRRSTTKQQELQPSSFAEQHHLTLVLSILTFATTIACTVSDVSLVVGLTGAAMGSMIVYLFPVLIYATAVKQVYGQDSLEYYRAKWRNVGLIPFSVLIAGLGVYMTLKQ